MTNESSPRFAPQVRKWIDEEIAEQLARYQKIVEEMEAIEPERERWIREFLERIQTRGYNMHADMLRQIAPEEIPKRPDRKLRVVF